jgi:putative SOS response-associated peptidase YedK
MCGRYSLTAVPTRVEAFLGASDGAVLRPRYNVAPGQDVPVAVAGPAGRRALVLRRWGLVPRFARDPAAGARSANARVETAAEHPAFREAFRARRCLVPADGFYEWRRRRGGAEPHHVTLPDGALFAMAGLWERFEPPDGPALETCAVLTGPARGRVRELHARAPILVAPADFGAWLDPAARDPERLRALLSNQLAESLSYRAVDPRVNDPRFDEPACLAPAPQLSLL